MGWLNGLFAKKQPKMDAKAALKREQVLKVVPQLNEFMQATRQHVIDDDLKIPRRFSYYVAYAFGAMQLLGEVDHFEEGQELAGLLIFLQTHFQLEPRGVSEAINGCMAMREEEEGQQAIQAGREAMSAWQGGDQNAVKTLSAIFETLS